MFRLSLQGDHRPAHILKLIFKLYDLYDVFGYQTLQDMQSLPREDFSRASRGIPHDLMTDSTDHNYCYLSSTRLGNQSGGEPFGVRLCHLP